MATVDVSRDREQVNILGLSHKEHKCCSSLVEVDPRSTSGSFCYS